MQTSKPRIIILVVIIVLVALLIGWRVQKSRSNNQPITATGETVSDNPVMQAFHNWQQAESYQLDTKLALHLPEMNGQLRRPFQNVSMSFTGDVQNRADSAPEAVGTLHGEAQGQGANLSTDGEIKLLADSVLFRLQTVPVVLDPTGSLTNKWTLVDTKLLRTTNNEAVMAAIQPVVEQLQKDGKESQDGVTTTKYQGAITEEQAKNLQSALALPNSGNQMYNIVARLLDAYTVKSLTVWIDHGEDHVRRLELQFLDRNQVDQPRAELSIGVKDFGKEVTIDRPQPVESVAPAVFGQFFNMGQVATPTPTARPRR